MKIGITLHPHVGIPRSLKGGDWAVNLLIKEALERAGHDVTTVELRGEILRVPRASGRFFRILRGLTVLLNQFLIPVVATIKLNRLKRNFDVMICDSTVLLHIDPERVINFFHLTYWGYNERVGTLAFNWRSRFVYRVLSAMQRFGARRTYNVCVSEFVKADMERLGLICHKVVVNSVDTDQFTPDDSPPRGDLAYAGGFAWEGKGLDILARLAAKGFSITCITNLEPGHHLLFRPSVSREQMPRIYGEYRVFLYPSRSEGCQMVPLEAMACGRPVVISNVGFAPSLKREIPEFVVDGYDDGAVEEYARRILLILSRYEEFSTKARHYVLRHHSYNKFREAWLDTVLLLPRVPNADGP